MSEMIHLGWVNDTELRDWWIDRALNVKPMGKKRLLWELHKKGLKGSDLQEVLEDRIDDETEMNLADRWLDVKLATQNQISPQDKPKQWRRLMTGLRRNGFSEGVIHRVLESRGLKGCETSRGLIGRDRSLIFEE